MVYLPFRILAAMLSPPRHQRYQVSPVGDQIERLLTSDEDFRKSSSFREQCARACIILRDLSQSPMTYDAIAKVMGVARATVRDHYMAFMADGNNAGKIGRPAFLSEHEMDELVNAILTAYADKEPMMLHHIKRSIDICFNKQISSNTLHHILARDPRIRGIRAVPMDCNRIQVSLEEVISYFSQLFNNISGAPPHFVFNMHEMGHQDWADAKETVCYGPATSLEDKVYYPVPRTGKRITLVACIAADGSYLKPCLVIHRKTFDNELALHGYTREKVTIYSQSKSFIDADIFCDWMEETFVPEVIRRRAEHDYHGPAFLVLDNCTAHSGELFHGLCNEHNIVPVFLPPHSSNQLQPLDLCIFGLAKAYIGRVNKFEKVNVQTDHILRILKGFHNAASPPNITATFRNAGISLILVSDEAEDPLCLCKITPETARCLLEPIEPYVNSLLPEIPDDALADEAVFMEDQGFVEDFLGQMDQ
jgi:hypothetical protein